MTKQVLLVDTNLCTGCWTCAMSCHVAHHLPETEYWCYVRTLGGGGIDEPAGDFGQQYMSWEPVYTRKCTQCKDRSDQGLLPHCVHNCPTGALMFGDIEDDASEISKRYQKLIARGYRVIPRLEWEQINPNVLYLSKG